MFLDVCISHSHTHTHTHTHTHMRMHARIHAHTHVHTHTRTHAHAHTKAWGQTHAHKHMRMAIHTDTVHCWFYVKNQPTDPYLLRLQMRCRMSGSHWPRGVSCSSMSGHPACLCCCGAWTLPLGPLTTLQPALSGHGSVSAPGNAPWRLRASMRYVSCFFFAFS